MRARGARRADTIQLRDRGGTTPRGNLCRRTPAPSRPADGQPPRDLLDLIVNRARNLPLLLLLITYRPDFSPPRASHAHATTLVLNRLGSRQVIAMADQITGKRLPREVCSQIIDLSDGVPLFVEEVKDRTRSLGLDD